MSQADQPVRITLTLADVFRAYQTMRRIDAVVEQHGLTASMLLMLQSVADQSRSPVSTHARALGLTPSVVSNGLDRIEKRGLVRRIVSSAAGGSSDRREVLIEATERGQELLDALAEIEIEL